MLKRFIYGGIFAVVFLGLVLVIILNRTQSITPVSLFEAIPEDAVVIMENIDYDYFSGDLISQNTIWSDLSTSSDFSGIDSSLRAVLNHLSENSAFVEILKKGNLSLSFHLIGKDKLQPLLYIDYSGDYSSKEFINIFTDFLDDKVLLTERRYEAELIYDVTSKVDYLPESFSFTSLNGIFLLSPSSILVEESVRVMNSDGGFIKDEGFQKVLNTSGRFVHANIYLNFEKLNQLFFPFVDHVHWGAVETIKHFANWGELDVDIKDDAVILNGMTYVSDSIPLFLGNFRDQSPVKIEMTDILPSNTFYFLHLGVNDKEKFNTQLLKYIAETGERVAFDEESDRIKEKYGIEPFKDLIEVMDDEIVWFSVEGNSDELTSEIVAIESKSSSLARSKLHNWYEQYLRVNRFEQNTLITQFKLDNQTTFDIYRLPDQFYENQKAGKFFGRYYAVYDKYILFGPNFESLSAVIYQNVLHKTLSNDPVFEQVSEYFSSRSNVSIFIKPATYLKNRSALLNEETLQTVGRNESLLRKVSGMVIQYSKEDEMFYNNITLKYSSHIKERAMTAWESLLDTVAIIKPSLVINHKTSEKEIFIQDANNKIYLINGTGRILWSLQIEAPIMSEIFQIDFYKNNKLQLLFNTEKKIHLIDRNGNYLERYPVNLRADATNSMSLFDYDKSRNYRIFIAGIDRKVYLYDKEGNILTDWKFRKTEGIVSKPVQHFRVDEKDYIIVIDQVRTYILDRRGKERVKPDKNLTVSEYNVFYMDMNIMNGKPRWITTDTSGNVVSLYLNGETDLLLERDATTHHFFRMQDMNRDGVPDYLLTQDNELEVFNNKGDRIFTFKTKGSITLQPDIYKFSASDIKIGITDRENKRIYLINSDGSLHEGFPLEGYTRFSIGYFAGSDSRFNLIVGSSNSFLYNYSIE